jgi:1-acyl-sn-glycerol-3-phosphate acyltransferase
MLVSNVLIRLVRLLVGASPRWMGCEPSKLQRIYFANHTSHIDTIAVWSALPEVLRVHTRTVAARDYWDGSTLRRYIALRGFNAVLIDRASHGNTAPTNSNDPLQPLYNVLAAGQSLIIFPEGTRKAQALPEAFKSGLFHLAKHFPTVELIPVYLENLHRAMPKGTFIPLPLNCSVRFGAPMTHEADEQKDAFLNRARQRVVELA